MQNFFALTDITRVLLVFTCSLILFTVIYNWLKSRDYPPGPIGLPLIGYVPFLGKNPHLKLRDLAKEYGDIFSFYIGTRLNICVNDYHLIKEILNHPNTLSRHPHSFDFMVGHAGMIGMNGEKWKEQRRFVMHTMRNLGLGRGLWENMTKEVISEFIKHLKSQNGQPIIFDKTLSISQIQNSISLLFGRHLNMETEKEDIEMMISFGEEMVDHFSSVEISFNMPELIQLVKFLNFKGFQKFINSLRRFESVFEKEVMMRIEKRNEIDRDDFIGCYLKEIDRRGGTAESQGFSVTYLVGNLLILLTAGNDSTRAGVGWLLLLMAKHQDVQKKVCDEIDRVLGRDGTIYYDDRLKLPYTTAAVLEMLRWASISALFPPRYVEESFTFHGYEIPAGCHIVSNSWAMMHDPRYFEDPMEYKPERFLDGNGSVKLSKVDGYGPFSFGKRNCPGDGVATMTIYLYFTSLMQKFHIKTPDGVEPDMTYKFSAGILPMSQKLCFIER